MSLLINGTYPIPYFTLEGVESIQYPDTFWWSSKPRFAAENPSDRMKYLTITSGGEPTSEYLEIDLGRIRQINYLTMDVMRVPVDISIDYDQVNALDGTHEWVPVKRREDMEFSERVSYDANNRNAWYAAQFYFTDSKGKMIHTRHLRIRLARRDEEWPTRGATPFRWPISVKHLRTGRYISGIADTLGPLLMHIHDGGVEAPTDITGREIRQSFVYPTNAKRGNLTPSMLGFGVLIHTEDVPTTDEDSTSITDDHSWLWSLWDVTNPDVPTLLYIDTEVGVAKEGKTWLDCYLPGDMRIEGDTTKTYEFRITPLNSVRSKKVYTDSPARFSNIPLSGTLGFTNGSAIVTTTVDLQSVVKVGNFVAKSDTPDQVFTVSAISASQITFTTTYSGVTTAAATAVKINPMKTYNTTTGAYVATGSSSLQMRVWADVGDEGRDVLGNSYRYGVHRDEASYVYDGTKAGWMSAPKPSPTAVEALYFDVRDTTITVTEEGEIRLNTLRVIDAVRISPRTPGVRMHIYYSQMNVEGDRPQTRDHWDSLLWTPVHEHYILRRNTTIELPKPVKAAFIKLEFTNLRPLPYRIPSLPSLPPVEYQRFPSWVEDQFNNNVVRRTVEDWFVQSMTPVQQRLLEQIKNPVEEFQYKQREFLVALALGAITDEASINSGIIDVDERVFIDPATSQRIYIQTTDGYRNTLLLNVDKSSLLGQIVVERYNPRLENDSLEGTPPTWDDGGIPLVSTSNNRVAESYSFLSQTPMRFNQRSRHTYKTETAIFNRKAYFVGIDEVQFLRNNYVSKYDDALISDILFDDEFLAVNTWMREDQTSITDGQKLYVSYAIGNATYSDELVTFTQFFPFKFANQGGMAKNVRVYTDPSKKGVQFFLGDDYDMLWKADANGILTNYIVRSALSERLVAPKLNIVYKDVGTAIGVAFIPSPPTVDAAVVTGVAVPITTDEGIDRYSAAVVTSIAVASATDTHEKVDAATVTAVAVASAEVLFSGFDNAPAIGVAVASAVITFTGIDSGTVTGVALVSGEVAGLMSHGVFGRSGTTFADLRLVTTDAATATGTAVPSAVEVYIPA